MSGRTKQVLLVWLAATLVIGTGVALRQMSVAVEQSTPAISPASSANWITPRLQDERASRSEVRKPAPKPKPVAVKKVTKPKPKPRPKPKPSTRTYLPNPSGLSTTARWIAAQKWAKTPKAVAVRMCESNYAPQNEVNDGVHYYGIWQMNRNFWLSNGGLSSYLPRGNDPFRASRSYQNYVAYRGYLSRGWQPWACA